MDVRIDNEYITKFLGLKLDKNSKIILKHGVGLLGASVNLGIETAKMFMLLWNPTFGMELPISKDEWNISITFQRWQ